MPKYKITTATGTYMVETEDGGVTDNRSGMQVAGDQAKAVLGGIGDFVTGIPGNIASAASAAADMTQPGGMQRNVDRGIAMLKGAKDTAAPLFNDATNLAKSLMDYRSNTPQSTPEQQQGYANAAGQNIAPLLIGEAIDKGPGLAKALSSKVSSMAGKISPENVNNWLDVKTTALEHGGNPGKQIVSEGLIGPTKEATVSNIKTALNDASADISAKLQQADSTGKTFNLHPIIKQALDDAEKTIGKSSDPAFTARLQGILGDIAGKHPTILDATPSETQSLIKDIGSAIKWTGAPYEGDINQALVSMRGELSTTLKTAFPDLKAPLTRWGNLFEATKAGQSSLLKDAIAKGTGIKPPTAGNNLAAALAEYGKKAVKPIIGGSALYGAYKAVTK